MSRKDYETIARAIRCSRTVMAEPGAFDQSIGPDDAIDCTVGWIISALADDNPRFDADRFRVAAAIDLSGALESNRKDA